MAKEAPEVSLFREYLRIKTVQPNPDYEGSTEFLKRIANDLDLPVKVFEMVAGKPIVVMTWQGTEPGLKSILLNSHTDVVPVFPEGWKYDPFEAVKEENGDIYARGAQDMKCVGIQHIEAVRRLKKSGKRFARTIHLCFMPEEEVGGADGMAKFVHATEFAQLNVGLALDEGIASPDETLSLFYGERTPYRIRFICKGNPGHGSQFIEDTAAEKFRVVIDAMLDFRDEEKRRLERDRLELGDVTTVNLTSTSGGVQNNVVPSSLSAGFDIRVSPKTNMKDFDRFLDQVVEKAGGGIERVAVKKFDRSGCTTSIDPDYPWFKAVMLALNKHKLTVKPAIFAASTDSGFLRTAGIPAYGFSPMNNTPILLHDHNEFLNESVFMRGIDVFVDVINEVANCRA